MPPELDKKSYGCKKYCCWNEGGGAKPWNIRLAYLYLSVLDYEFEINDLQYIYIPINVGPSKRSDQYLGYTCNKIYRFSPYKLMLVTGFFLIQLQNFDSQLKHSKENLFIKLFAFQ